MIRFSIVSCQLTLHMFRESFSACPFLDHPYVPFFLVLFKGAVQSFLFSVLSLLTDSGTSSTKKQLSIVAATTLGCVPSEVSAFPSWIRKLG